MGNVRIIRVEISNIRVDKKDESKGLSQENSQAQGGQDGPTKGESVRSIRKVVRGPMTQ